uniref:Uncharacterized protein n=1 Tax=Seriola dumerili TaxID=41447 RepID=A0A3B4U337_SERDU
MMQCSSYISGLVRSAVKRLNIKSHRISYKTSRYIHVADHHSTRCFSFFLCPLQEVSAFEENGEGMTWTCETVQLYGVHWEARRNRALQTRGHGRLPERDGQNSTATPIRGQREVHGMSSSNQHNWWRAMEGVFIQPSQELLRHDEL